jgi:hypothetical protein
LKVKSNINDNEYDAKDVVRIVNQKQILFYINSGVYPIDLYASYDERNDRKIVVMIFEKERTKELYQKWCNYDVEI